MGAATAWAPRPATATSPRGSASRWSARSSWSTTGWRRSIRGPPSATTRSRVYEGLLAEGVDPGRILVAGDSAGGHLSLALALKLREAGRPQPAALGLICPWLDLRESAMARRPESPREPFLSREIMAAFTRDTLRDPADADDPLTSPVIADLEGLAPIVLHSSGDDPLAVEADELARRAAEQGVALEHRRFDGVWHVVHLHEPFLRGVGAVEALTASLRRHLKS